MCNIKLIRTYRRIALAFIVLCSTMNANANAQTYSAHAVRLEANVLIIPTGFLAYDYRPLEHLSLAVGAGTVIFEDSSEISKFGYMTRVSGLIGSDFKYFELGSGLAIADSRHAFFILASYRYQPVNGWLWGAGMRFTYTPPTEGQTQYLITILSSIGFNFQFGYAF